MPFINVYFSDKRIARRELTSGEITIGRTRSNDIPIDNPGVSASHAVIRPDGEDFFIEDLGSKNGTYLNGRKITRHKLEYGDTITIFKHRLVFVPWSAGAEDGAASNSAGPLIDQTGTVQMDASRLGEILSQHAGKDGVSQIRIELHVRAADGKARILGLTGSSYCIGKKSDCLVKTSGLLAPSVSARLQRRGGDYLLIPEKKGDVLINGEQVDTPVLLEHGDQLEIRKTRIRYHTEILLGN